MEDEKWQQMLFSTLGLNVKVYHDQTADEIIQLVDSVRAECPFILSIISPGDQTSIHCNDGKTIMLNDLESCVSKASIDKIPKVAIFDIYQTNETAVASNYRRIANIENTLTVTSVTSSGNDSQLTKILYDEILNSNEDQSLSQIAEIIAQKLQDKHQQHVEFKDTLQHPYYIKRLEISDLHIKLVIYLHVHV